jgi:hypothetical protein
VLSLVSSHPPRSRAVFVDQPDAAVVATRHWRSYGNDPLPTGVEALDEPFSAFPSWFLRIECARCGNAQMINQAHMRWDSMPLVTSSCGCVTTAAAVRQGARSCSQASRAPAAGRCEGSRFRCRV